MPYSATGWVGGVGSQSSTEEEGSGAGVLAMRLRLC